MIYFVLYFIIYKTVAFFANRQNGGCPQLSFTCNNVNYIEFPYLV